MNEIKEETAQSINNYINKALGSFSQYLLATTTSDTAVKDFEQYLKSIKDLLVKELPAFNVNYSVGAGNRTEQPWLLVKKEDNKASKGIYFLINFFKKGEDNYKAKISLNQGAEEFGNNVEKQIQRAEHIRSVLSKEEQKILDTDIYSEEWDTTKSDQDLAERLNKYLGYYQEYLDNKILIEYNSILKARKNLVLTGAPGTGKTYLAKEMAAYLTNGTSYKNLTEEQKKQIGFVQFHPSYGYTDFVEGLRSYENNNGDIGFRREDGTFKKFCKKALEDLGKEWNKQKSYVNTEDIKVIDDATLKSKHLKHYVFIIDEINRGELSKIFGELFYSIDPGYRGESGKVATQYQNLIDIDPETQKEDVFKNGFYVPKNVYIIGTMNDIDRSVEPMDFAVRRRFCWMDVKPEDRIAMWGEKDWFATANELMSNLNVVIKHIESLGEPFCLGPAYFNDPPLMPNLSTKEVIDKYDLWKLRIEPILKEYMRPLIKEEASDNMALLNKVYFEGGAEYYEKFCNEKEHTLDEFKKFFEDKKKKNKDKVVEE